MDTYELSNKEKAAISELLQVIADDTQLNKKALGLPLYYIPKASHTLLEIFNASTDLIDYYNSKIDGSSTSNLVLEDIYSSPLLSALHKTKLLLVNKEYINSIPAQTRPKLKFMVMDATLVWAKNPLDTIVFLLLPHMH